MVEQMTLVAPLGLLHWESASASEKAAARSLIASAIQKNADALVGAFYNVLLNHEASAQFLSHAVVQERLSNSLRNWLLSLIDVDPIARSREFEQLQLRIGEVHSRINIPNHLVLAGAILLKTEISRQMTAQCNDTHQLANSMIFLNELVDHAVRIMCSAYDTNSQAAAKTNEAYRYLALGEDVDLERAHQFSALMEWSQSVLFRLLADSASTAQNPISTSPFGLWLRHRACHLFAGSEM